MYKDILAKMPIEKKAEFITGKYFLNGKYKLVSENIYAFAAACLPL